MSRSATIKSMRMGGVEYEVSKASLEFGERLQSEGLDAYKSAIHARQDAAAFSGSVSFDVDPLTFDDLQKALAELQDVPDPPVLKARPEFIELLRSKLPLTDAALMGHVEIREVPGLPFRWLCRYDGTTTVETLEGKVYAIKDPPPLKLEDITIPLPPVDESEGVYAISWRGPPVAYPTVPLYLDGCGVDYRPQRKPRRKRASRGWRKHVRRVKAAERRGTRGQ